MYNVLAIDDDRTCLYILKACLEKWKYQVTLVKDAHEALSMLRNKSFDLVITDVHMPDMNGLELQDRINQDFSLPVILISADSRAEVMCMGINNGAQRFFVKPIVADNLKDIWQFVEWWKRNRNHNTAPGTQINGSSEESLTLIGSHKDKDNTIGAVPANILQVMNVEGLTRDQVASHLQYCLISSEMSRGKATWQPKILYGHRRKETLILQLELLTDRCHHSNDCQNLYYAVS
ncbi:hypothetical protein DCAR_0414932 [Daucus carota subsp. sativus]|uniref:Response regulatory domain-containing protein n=1 Tax=Daucus carota subsp. sativus TaxID=79200 RepID=A0AAF0WTN9_DAUCS|nr:hypothetical protein DCAR_0414932 [Daucus carota subsp. sativus]